MTGSTYRSSSSFSSRGAVGMGAGSAMGASRLGMAAGGMMSGKSGSVYGGAGGMGVRISSSSAMGGGFGLGAGAGGFGLGLGGGGGGGGFALGGGGGGAGFGMGGGSGDVVAVSEKMEMQNLNSRLAVYLEKVATLEKANFDLEEKIKSWGLSRVVEARDFSAHLIIIDDVRAKIMAAGVVIAELILGVDNTKLAADDFRIKYESELGLRMSVDADIAGLRRMLGELGLMKTDLEMQLEGLKEEKEYMTKNHDEEKLAIRGQLSGQINVEVDAAPQVDLSVIMADIREQYEATIAKSHKDAEAWFKNKAEVVQKEVIESVEVIQTTSLEVKESKTTLMTLELELQSLLSMKASLELNLAELEGRYGAMMMALQGQVVSMESQLTQIRADTEKTGQEYKALLDIKSRLEMEIGEYRRLLEGEGAVAVSAGAGIASKTMTQVTEVVSVIKAAPVVESSASVSVAETVVDSSLHSHSTTTTTVTETVVETVSTVVDAVEEVVAATEEVEVSEE